MGFMKLIPLLLCAAIMAAAPVSSQAGGHMGGLRASLGMGMGAGFFMGPRDDRGRYHGEAPGRGGAPNNPRRDDNRYNAPPPPPGPVPVPGNVYRRDAYVYDRRPVVVGGGEYRDQRINRAIAIGQGHGRVLNAWPQGGSLFVVRVDTPRGRVDMIIDVDTGRIVGER
jgi:hypothetical protein